MFYGMQKVYTVIKLLSVIGILLAVYLLWLQATTPDDSICNLSASVNCEAIVTGPVAKTLGIPTPLIGLVGYIVILFSSLKKMKITLLSMAAFGLIFCLYIAYREIFELSVICPVCIVCQINMIIIFILSIFINLNNNKQKQHNPAEFVEEP